MEPDRPNGLQVGDRLPILLDGLPTGFEATVVRNEWGMVQIDLPPLTATGVYTVGAWME